MATYSGLDYTKDEDIKLKATSGSLTAINSTEIVMSPAPADYIGFTTQPAATAISGVDFTTQPVITFYDVYENICN